MSRQSGVISQKMIHYFEGDIIRINHALKVYGFAKTIGELEGLSDIEQEILETAAFLHDIGIKNSEIKYNSSAGNYQEIEGPPVAKELLKDLNLDEKIVNRICFLIGHHHSYDKIDKIDFQILVEADFLVNIFEDKIKEDTIPLIKEKYFKTTSGKDILESLYLR